MDLEPSGLPGGQVATMAEQSGGHFQVTADESTNGGSSGKVQA